MNARLKFLEERAVSAEAERDRLAQLVTDIHLSAAARQVAHEQWRAAEAVALKRRALYDRATSIHIRTQEEKQ